MSSDQAVRSHVPPQTNRVLMFLALAVIAVLAWEISRGGPSLLLLRLVSANLNRLASYADMTHGLSGWLLYGFAFAGGLAASISPCILGMLPLNLSYIGTAKAGSRMAAVRLATWFVVGVAFVNTALGVAGSLFFDVFSQYRGVVNVGVGVLIIVSALWMADILHVGLPNFVKTVPTGLGPLAIGVAFGLVTSPCSSPILVAVLAAASKDGNVWRALSVMAIYSAGYTAVIWFASVVASLSLASRWLLQHGRVITVVSAACMSALGLGTVVYGLSLL